MWNNVVNELFGNENYRAKRWVTSSTLGMRKIQDAKSTVISFQREKSKRSTKHITNLLVQFCIFTNWGNQKNCRTVKSKLEALECHWKW